MGEEHEDLMIACETAKAMWDLLAALSLILHPKLYFLMMIDLPNHFV